MVSKHRARLGNAMKNNQNLLIIAASGSDHPGIIDRLPRAFSYLNVDIPKNLQAPSQRLPAGTCFGRAGAFRRLVRWFCRHTAVGDPASEILELVERERADLVVISSRGRKSHFNFGSVAKKIVRHSMAPVPEIPTGKTA
jgi:hypothetical protein